MKRKFLLFRSVLLTLLLLLGAQGATAANYIKGSWDSWAAHATDASGNVSIDLAASTTYQFKLHDTGMYGSGDTWYSNSGTMTSTNCTGWEFTTSVSGDAQITTTVAGTYTFHVTWSGSTPTISVTYPSSGPVPPVATDLYMWYQIGTDAWTATTSKLTTDASGIGHYTITGDDSNKDKKMYVTFSKSGTVDWAAPWRCSADTEISPSTEYTKGSGSSVWYIAALEKGYNYTFNVDEANSKFSYDKTAIVSTTYNLVLGSVPQTANTTGLFTVDLQSATEDKEVSFLIDGDAYKLETAATISAAGTTNYTVKTEATTGTAFLTLTKGLIYYFTIQSNGSVSVRAVDPSSIVDSDFAYYLVGNFMDTDGSTISEENCQDRKFRFFKDTDGSYYFDIPATLNVSNQIVAVSPMGVATIYGPSAGDQTLSTSTISDNGSRNYDLTANTNEFNTVDRDIVSGGMYRYRMTVDTDGLPTSVKITHDKKTLVAYYWPEATTTSPSPTAQPTYTVRKSDGGSDNKYFGNVYLEDGQYCWVISNITKDADTHKASALVTKTRLFKQGNGGGDVINNLKPDGTDKPSGVDYHKVYPYFIHQYNRGDEYKANLEHDGFTFENGGAYTLEYNPSKGADEVTGVTDNQRIGGEVLKASGGPLADPIETISVIGPGIPASASWDIATKQVMTYNQQLQCYEYTFTKTTPESDTEHFRFVANDNWKMNWEENSNDAADKARVPYRSTNAGHSAMVDDPNYIKRGYAKDPTTGSERADEGTHDIILNRPEGEWTIRFYIKTKPNPDNGNEYLVDYYYTITGSPSAGFDIPVYGGRVLCSFSSSKSLNIPDGYRAYVAHRFTPKVEGSDNTKDGQVDLYRITYIPENVGVILYGDDPQLNGAYVTVPFTEYEDEEKVGTALWYYPEKHTGETFKNYLVAAPDGTVLSTNGLLDTRPEYYDSETGVFKYYVYLSRYFAFTWFSKTLYANYYDWTSYDYAPKTGTLKAESTAGTGLVFPTAITDYASFYRAAGTVGKNRAYLDLPAEVMGYSGQALSQTQDETDTHGNPLFSKSGLRFEDFYYEDYSDEFSTAIQPIVNVANGNMDNTFYNIQGMKVANPTKGLYIINGKKMIVK